MNKTDVKASTKVCRTGVRVAPKKASKMYTKDETGCYIDGAFGMDHALRKMADLVGEFDKKLEKELDVYATKLEDRTATMDDHEQADEALREATDVLQDHTVSSLMWVWEAGDLILMRKDDYMEG